MERLILHHHHCSHLHGKGNTDCYQCPTSDIAEAAQAALLQGVQVPAESVHFVQVENHWLKHTVCFEPSLKLPLCLSSLPIVANGPAVWVAVHNLRAEPVTLNTGHRVVMIEATEVIGPTEITAKGHPCTPW